MRAGRHFCEHGNLRNACATCREARRSKHRGIETKTYGPRVRPGQPVPKQPWTTDQALTNEQAAALRALQVDGGVVRVPASAGTARIALGTLKAWRHEKDGIILLVPNERAVEAWDDLLRTRLHVPTHDLEASGRQVKDWARLPAIRILSPIGAARNRSGIRQHARRMILVVDSPDHDGYEDLVDVLAFPFARKAGFATSRFGPVRDQAWPRLDALGGIVHEQRVEDAITTGELRPLRYEALLHEPGSGDALVHLIGHCRKMLGAPGSRSLLLVDDVGAGRAAEEALARAGIEPRFIGPAASEGLAERVGRVMKEGGARVLVTTIDAPRIALGPIDNLLIVSDTLGADAAAARVLGLLGAGENTSRPLRVVDLVPTRAPPTRPERMHIAQRILRLATAARVPLPPLGWLAEAMPTPPLPAPWRERVAALEAERWSDVLGLLADAIDALRAEAREDARPIDEAAAAAALADLHVAARTGCPTLVPLGPLPRDEDVDGLLGRLPAHASLIGLAPRFPEARRALVALHAGDLDAFLAAFAGAPLLHHLVPDARAMALATLDDPTWRRLPAHLEPDKVAEITDAAARHGPASTKLPERPAPTLGDPVSPSGHLDALVAMLDAEKALEQEESLHEIERMSGTERQRAGRTLLGLDLVGKQRAESGVMLRYGLPTPTGAEGRSQTPRLPYTELSPGSLVRLSSGDRFDPVGHGTVANVTDRILEIIVEEDRERRAPGKDTRVDLVGNPRVYDTLARAARRVYGQGALGPGSGKGGLREYLLLVAPGGPTTVPSFRFHDPSLNPSQRNAVTHALAADRLSLVHGPPGTGKTTTLVELIRQEVARGHRVLVTADSNAAVDNIMDAYVRAGGVGVRTGPLPSLTRPQLVPMHIDRLRARAPGVPWLERIPVVFSTHVSSGSLPDGLAFDVVVQDEASQATEPASCVSLQRAPKLVLAGDHLQLPPVVRSDEAARLGLGISLFERLFAVYGESHGNLLSVQYRMHASIAAWSNEAFYHGRIGTAVDPEPVPEAVAAGFPASERALFVDVRGRESTRRTSKERVAEAAWITEHVSRLVSHGVDPATIAVIAAYRAQVRLLRDLFRQGGLPEGVAVGTIDAFQGSERDIVFVSLVRSNVAGEVGFVRDPRRLNVAMTRAKRHLVVVGDAATLSKAPLIKSLIASMTRWKGD